MIEKSNSGNSIFNLIKNALTQNIKNENVFFVFPTDIDATSWAEWVIINTSRKAVPAERFIAWDTFKGSNIKIRKEDANAVPSLLRKIFAMQIIESNKACIAADKEPLLKKIITKEYAQTSDSFCSWIASILPSLGTWKKYFDKADKSKFENSLKDEENQDLLFLYTEYKKFLEENQLFEPSWEEIDFSFGTETEAGTDNKAGTETEGGWIDNVAGTGGIPHFILFFPEVLEDFADYKELFAKAPNLTIITTINAGNAGIARNAEYSQNADFRPEIITYSNARTELRKAALKIRELHDKNNVPWTSIALNVPEIQTLKPYVERELGLYSIPYIMRSGSSYTRSCAGQIFNEIKACIDNNFSYDSVRTLLTDMYVPWLEKECNENLIREGFNRKCLYSYKNSPEDTKLLDVWELSLSSGISGNTTERELALYRKLKKCVLNFSTAKTFSDVRLAWFNFRETLLAKDNFSEHSDLILGQCLAELSSLIDIETSYDIHIKNPFSFFITDLETKTYQMQHSTEGISVFDYKVASCAAFEYQFVINANQKALTVQNRHLTFLNKEKRKSLGLIDSDVASTAFIKLYAKDKSFFSSAEQGFSGFTIPHSFFVSSKEKNQAEEAKQEKNDFITQEKEFFIGHADFPAKITENQKATFEMWQKRNTAFDGIEASSGKNSSLITTQKLISEKLCKKRGLHTKPLPTPENLHISTSDLNAFFKCPRRWVLNQVLNIEEDSLDTELFSNYDNGNILHKILELFMKEFKGKKLPVTDSEGKLPDEETVIKPLITKCVKQAFLSPEQNFKDSPIALTVLASQIESYTAEILEVMRVFCQGENKGFGGHIVYDAESWLNCKGKSCSAKSDDSDSTSCGAEYAAGGYYITGKIDCILTDENGNVSIVDYKSSAKSSSAFPKIQDCTVRPDYSIPVSFPANEKLLSNFQIAAYITLWNENHSEEKISRGYFFSIKDRYFLKVVDENAKPFDPEKKLTTVTPEEYEPTLKCFLSYCDIFAEKVSKMDFSLKEMGIKPYETCASCSFKTICRTTFDVSGEKIDE